MVPITMHPNQGWQCPACKRCYAPSIPFCDCAKNAAVSSATTTEPVTPSTSSVKEQVTACDTEIKTDTVADDIFLLIKSKIFGPGGATTPPHLSVERVSSLTSGG